MINHFRTLLLNRSAPSYSSRAGEEYIPTDFAKLTNLPTYLRNIGQALYGRTPDWLFENYRTQQYLSLIHSTELEEFVTDLDPRITYDPKETEFFTGVFGPHSGKAGIRFIGEPPSPDASGNSILRWKITLVDDSTADIEQITPIKSAFTLNYTEEPLMPGLWLQFSAPHDTTWTAEYNRRPEYSLGEIMANVEAATAQYWNQLFGIGSSRSDSEPWKTFRNLWLFHPEMPYKFGGFLLAYVYALDLWRQNNG